MAADDAVALTDLRVVQEWSLAVRAATAPREELVRALEEDLAWLTGGTRPKPAAAAKAAAKAPAKKAARTPRARKA